ncbi:hypothetical protein FG379_001146 [Cryptosporidium bovis]|uniref:uncharacterized protein n=1 Tax=Cryptosporidium bovis TaxID=310047 RepID=UPI00351A14A4|nr:hypothetical protein FG379_001146 [Cryptosporidium bovis]
MRISRSEFDDLSTSSASMLVVTTGSMKLYSRLLRIMPESFKIAICVGLKHEPIREVAMLPKRRAFATLGRKYSGTDKEITQLEHRIQRDFGIPIPICLDNKSTTVRVVIFLVTNDKSMIPVCRSLIRLSSTRDPTTAMKWFPLVKYNGFKGIGYGGSSDEFEKVKGDDDIKYKKHYIVGSIQILTRRILQDRIGDPDMIDILGFVVDAKETKNVKTMAEQYDDTTSEYEYSDKDLSSKENKRNFNDDELFNGKYSSKIKGCYLESTCESLEDKIPFPFIKFKDIIDKYATLKNLFHLIPQYNQKINSHMIKLMKNNKKGRIVLLGDDFFSKYRSGISVDIKVPSSIDYIMEDSLDWQTWLSKSLDIAIMQSVEAYNKSTIFSGTGRYKAGRCDMNEKSGNNFAGNKLALYRFDYFMKAMESNMDLLLLNTIFGAAATEFARDIIDDVIFSGRNQTKKFNPYKNLFVIWKYIIKRGYQELGFDSNDGEDSDIDSSTLENKVGEENIEETNIKDISDEEEHNIRILRKNYLRLENDFEEFSEIAKFDENAIENDIDMNEMPNNSLLNNNTIPLYNSLKRRIVDSIERKEIKPLPPDHPISSLRLFKRDLVFIYNKTIGRGLVGILVLGDENTSSEEASKIYTREISAHMAINEAIIRTKIKKAIKIYNSIPKGRINRRNIMTTNSNSLECGESNPASKKILTADELTRILLKGISKYSNSHDGIFHPAVSLTSINPTLITCVDYSGFRMVVRPLPVTPLTICDWPLPIQSTERSEISNIEKCLNISNILHPTMLISKVKHLPILLEYSIGIYNFYIFHHTYNIFPKDPWVSDIKGERLNWGNSSTDDYYYNYNKNIVIKNLSRNRHCILRPLFIKQSGAVQDMLKHQNNQEDTIRRLHYTSSDLIYLWKRELSPSGFCLLCCSDIQLRVFGFSNIRKDLTNLETVGLDVVSKYTETTGNGLIKIKDSTYCSLCGKSIRIKGTYDELDLKIDKRMELISYIGNKIPYPSLGNLDDGPGIKMNRTKLLTSYMNTTSEYFSEWGFGEGDIYRRDEIIWERKPGLYCLPRTCIRGGGNLLGSGLDTIKYLLSQGKCILADYDINIKINMTSDFSRESKLKIVNGIDVFDESKRQDTIKLFFDDTNIGQEIILLSNSLHTNWIAIILHQLESIPVFTPYDSITLENFLHSRGVNCNLMGRMLNYTRSPWLKQLLSVEIVGRTIKNLIPRIIKTLYLPGAISILKEEKGNYGKYCPCHLSSPSITMLHTLFKQYVSSVGRRNQSYYRTKNNKNKHELDSRIFSSKYLNSDSVADQDKLINRESLASKEKIPSHSTSLSIQSPVYWNEILSLLNENKWEVLNLYDIDLSEISKMLIDWASKYYNIDEEIGMVMTNSNNNNNDIHDDNCLLSESLGDINRLTLPYWVLETLFNINKKSLLNIKRHKFQQITIIQIVLTNLFNLILGDSPKSQLFWTKCISKLCSIEFTIAENSISKNKIPIGALYTSLQHHTGIKFYMDIKKLNDCLLKDPSFPITYDDFNMILPKTKRNTEQYYSESLPIWGMLETPELIRLPRYNNFSLVSTPTISQKLIALSIKLSASYFTNIQLLFDYLTHTELFKGSERHLVRQDWLVQESWLELIGYLSYLENDRLCLELIEKILNLYPQDNVSSIQMRLLQMWSFSRIRNVELVNNSKNKSRYNDIFCGSVNNNISCVSQKSIPHEVSVSTLMFEIIELHWSVIHPIIIDVYATTSLIHYIRGNWKSCEEILEKAITKCLVLSNRFESENDIIRHFNKLISENWNKNWEYENKEIDSKNSLKRRVMNNSIKYLVNYSNEIKNKFGDNIMEDYIYDKIYNSQTQYMPKLLDLIDNPYPNKIPRSPPRLRIAWLLKQLGKVRLIHGLENYNVNKPLKEKSTLSLLDDPVETLLELSCMATQWSLDIFDYYLGSSSLETASCCFELAYGLILLNEIINNERSQILLKRSKELLLASFDVNSTLLMPSHHICIDNLIQLALVYEKSNLFHQSLVIWEIVLEQLSIKCRSLDDDDYRVNCEFSLTGWFVPNKYFYSPLDFCENSDNSKSYLDENVNESVIYKNNKIMDEYIKINNYEVGDKNNVNNNKKKSEIILSSSYLSIESLQWNIKNSLMLLSKTKERIFYLFINKCNGNRYHKRLFRLLLLASYLKRGDKLVNLKDWEPILSSNSNNTNMKTNGDIEKEKSLSGLLFSVIYETNSWLYETEETNLAVSSFIENHPTKISRYKLFTGDGYSGPLSVLNNMLKMENMETEKRFIDDNNSILKSLDNENSLINSSHNNLDNNSNNDENSISYYLSMSGVSKIRTNNIDVNNRSGGYNKKNNNCINNPNIVNKNKLLAGKNEKNAKSNVNNTLNYNDKTGGFMNKKCTRKENLRNMGINLIKKNMRSNSREIITKIKESCENGKNSSSTLTDNFFIDLISEAENDIKIIWRTIKEQTQTYKKIKNKEKNLINKLNSSAQYERRINRLSKLKICEILNDENFKKIDLCDGDVEKSVLTRDINESSDISNISEINMFISNPMYKGTLIATMCESKNLLSKIMVNNSKKSTYDDEFEQTGSDSLVVYNSILKKETIIDNNNDNSVTNTTVKTRFGMNKNNPSTNINSDDEISEKTKKISGMKLNLENAFFKEDIEIDNSDEYTKSSPLSYRSNALDVLISIIYNVSNFKDYFSNWKESGSNIENSNN